MERPTGRDILGLEGDPTPGVVESVQALAKEFGDFAHDVESAYRSLNSFGSDTGAMQWVGQTADSFKAQYRPLPGRLQKLYTSYSEASDALAAYWPALQAAQSKADSALRQAQDANANLQRAQTNASSAAADLKTAQQNHAANPNPQAVTDAQTAHDTAQTNLNNAKAAMAALTKQANDAYDDRISTAKTCVSFDFDVAGREIQRLIGDDVWLTQRYDSTGRPVAQDLGSGRRGGAGADAGPDGQADVLPQILQLGRDGDDEDLQEVCYLIPQLADSDEPVVKFLRSEARSASGERVKMVREALEEAEEVLEEGHMP